MVKRLSILVACGQEEMCNMLDTFFSKVGYMVKAVVSGVESIELAEVENFDLVLCDLVKPDLTGCDKGAKEVR